MRKVPHEITLLAWSIDQAGKRSIYDIVTTSNKNASLFIRRWRRDPIVAGVSAHSPVDPFAVPTKIRKIR